MTYAFSKFPLPLRLAKDLDLVILEAPFPIPVPLRNELRCVKERSDPTDAGLVAEDEGVPPPPPPAVVLRRRLDMATLRYDISVVVVVVVEKVER